MSRPLSLLVRKNRDLFIVFAAVVLALASSPVDPASRFHALLAVPLVLFLPGYAVLEALRPRHLDVVQRLLTSIAVSFAVAILAGVALNWVPGGINRTSELSALSGITMLAAGVAWIRRQSAGLVGMPTDRPDRSSVPRRLLVSCCGLAALLAIAGLAVAYRAAAHRQRIDSPTRLWLLPNRLGSNMLRVGVENTDTGGRTYRLRVIDGSAPLREWSSLALPSGATWTASVVVPPTSAHRRIQAMLYISGSRTPYRWVTEGGTG